MNPNQQPGGVPGMPQNMQQAGIPQLPTIGGIPQLPTMAPIGAAGQLSMGAAGMPNMALVQQQQAAAAAGGVSTTQAMQMQQQMLTQQQQQQQMLLQQQIFAVQLQRNPNLIQQNPQLLQNPLYYAHYSRVIAQQQQAAQQAMQAARPALPTATAAGRPPTAPTGKAAKAAAAAAAAATAAAAAAAPAAGGSSGGGMVAPAARPSSISRKRKSEHYRLPDKTYNYLPESPMFVTLQDAERRVDAAIARKKAALNELYSSAKRVVDGTAVGDAPGSARKRLRMYIFSRHANQRPVADPSAPPQDPPSWTLSIYGRMLDPDAAHPGGGGDPEPPEDAHVPRHHFSSYVKRMTVRFEGVDGGPAPCQMFGPGGGSAGGGPVNNSSAENKVVWERSRHANEGKNSLEIRRRGDRPVKAIISFEMDHSPELFSVSKEVEAVVGLPVGEGGAPGLYSMAFLVSKIWAYGRVNNLLSVRDGRTFLKPDAKLLNALVAPLPAEARPAVAAELSEGDLEDLIKATLTAPGAITVQYSIPVEGPTPSPPLCIDLHLEVPLGLQDIPESVTGALEGMHKEVEQVDHALAAILRHYHEHRRRSTLLSAFSDDPVGCIRAIVAAQAKELRLATGKEAEAVEVMKAADMFGDKWTEDAILKYFAKKAALEANAKAQVEQYKGMMLQAQAAQAQVFAQAQAAAAAGIVPSATVQFAGMVPQMMPQQMMVTPQGVPQQQQQQ